MFLAHAMWSSNNLGTKIPLYTYYELNSNEADSKKYSPRGYFMIEGADNYEQASMNLFGDDRLLRNPNQVASDDDIAWLRNRMLSVSLR